MHKTRRTFSFFQPFQPAQSLLEVIIALAVTATIFTVSFLAISGQLIEISSGNASIQALAFAKEGLEASRLIRDQDWDTLTVGTHGLAQTNDGWGFQGTSDVHGEFTRTITITESTPNERLVTSEIRWPARTQTKQVRLSTVITNWRNVTPLLLSGDWRNPQTLSSMDLGAGNEATALAVRSGIVYVTAQASSENKPDFFIIDATDPAVPIMRGNISTGAGLNAVALSGSYAYVANQDDGNNGASLQAININDPNAPALVTTLQLGNDDDRSALSIAISGSYAYVGTEQSSNGPELYVIEITDPMHPVVRGSAEIGAEVRRIAISENRLVLATSKDEAEFIVMNTTDPAQPVQSATYNVPGTNDALGLYLNPLDQRAYLTRRGGSASNPDISILDFTNPDAPTLLGSYVLNTDTNAVFAADALAFFVTSAANEEFKIYDATNPNLLTSYAGLNFPQVGIDLGFENNILYAAVRSNDALRIITSQ